MAKIDILYIHGGMTFRNQKSYLKFLSRDKDIYLEDKITWTGKYLTEKLGKKTRIIRPKMPLADNARYIDWKIYFERYLPSLNKKYILIGQSLGATFLAKYLSENKLVRKALAVYLVAPPFDNTLTGEDLVGGFNLKSNLSLISKNTDKLVLMFSRDDDCVPLSHSKKYREKLPEAIIKIYKNKKGHFKITKFPEIVNMIKKDI